MTTDENILVEHLQLLGLFHMAESLTTQIRNPEFQKTDPMKLFICAAAEELSVRTNKKTESLLRSAKLKYTCADLTELEYRQDRGLDRNLIKRLSTGEFIQDCRNLCIIGSSGTGKTFLGKAFGVESCRHGHRTLYIRFPNLMRELVLLEKKDPKRYEKRLKYYGKFPLLVIDEWLLNAQKPGYAGVILELLEIRYAETSTIFCSQIDPDGWSAAVDVKAIGQSIFGRAISNSFIIPMKGEDLRRTFPKKP